MAKDKRRATPRGGRDISDKRGNTITATPPRPSKGGSDKVQKKTTKKS